MRLTLGTGEAIEDPTADQVEAALRALPGGPDSFAILGADDHTYMQTSGGADDGFVLEVRAGAGGLPLRCTDQRLPADAVCAAFLAFLEGRPDYEADLDWEPDRELGPGAAHRRPRLAFAVLGILAAIAFTFYRCGT